MSWLDPPRELAQRNIGNILFEATTCVGNGFVEAMRHCIVRR